MSNDTIRRTLVRWMMGVALAHLAAGMLLPLLAASRLLDAYHHGVLAAFWAGDAPAPALALQQWWFALFGPTVQSLAILMACLVRLGDRGREPMAWAGLIVSVLLWAPQDIGISLLHGAWPHVWLDLFALLCMLPPLCWLWWHDRQAVRVAP